MIKNRGDTIYPGSVFALLFLSVTEVELYQTGRTLIQAAGRDAWLSILVAAPFTYIFLYIFTRLARDLKKRTFLDHLPRLWGKFLAYPLIMVFAVYELIWLVKTLRITADINLTYFLPQTPLLLVLFLFILGAIALSSGGLTPLTRFFEFMLPFFLIFFFVAQLLALGNARLKHFLPFLAGGILPVLKGALLYCTVTQGLEILLFAVPFAQDPRRTFLPAFLALTMFHLANLSQTIGILGKLSRETASLLIYPGNEMLTSLHVPGWPVERFELFLTLPWMIAVFTSISVALYLCSTAVLKILPLKNPKPVYWSAGLLAVALVYLIPNILWLLYLDNPFRFLTVLVIYLLPLASFVLFLFRQRRKEEKT